MRKKIIKFILIGIMTAVPLAASAQLLPNAAWRSRGLVFFAHLDEASWNGTTAETKDSSGRGNAGKAVTASVTASGHLGNAGIFAGNGYLTFPDSESLNFGTGPFSVAFWFKTTSTTFSRMISKGNWGQTGWQVALNENGVSGAIRFSSDGVDLVTPTTTYNDGAWHLLVFTWQNQTGRMYVDGTLQSVNATTQGSCVATPASGTVIVVTGCTMGIDNSADPLVIGAYQGNSPYMGIPGTPQEMFTGSIDEVRIWNRAITTTEISQLP